MSEILKGHGAPDINRTATLGDYYVDVDTEAVYKLVDIKYNTVTVGHNFAKATSHDGTYEFIWEACGGGAGGNEWVIAYAQGESHIRPLVIPEGTEFIADNAFGSEYKITSVTFPKSLKRIGNSAFANSQAITTVDFAEGLISIGAEAFNNCCELGNLTFPKSLEVIEASAFMWCDGINTVTFLGTPDNIATNVFNNCKYLTTINVPWAEGTVANAPWGAEKATVVYNYVG